MIAQQIAPLAVPEIAWSAIASLLVLVGGSLVLLTIAALVPGRWPRGLSTVITLVTSIGAAVSGLALHGRVTDVDRGPFTAIAGAVTVDAFTIFFTVLICVGVALVTPLADRSRSACSSGPSSPSRRR